MPIATQFSTTAIGIACGVGAAVLWAAGFVAARHGVDIGFAPSDLTFHRCFWAGLVLLPLALRAGIGDLNGVGWGRGVLLAILGGPGLALISYSGFLLVPLGHAGVIQPSCAALFGLLPPPWCCTSGCPRSAGRALIIVAGLAVIGGEAITTIGAHNVAGDLLFVLAGGFFATFSMLLRAGAPPTRPPSVMVSLAVLPIWGADRPTHRARSLGKSLQALMRGLLAGPAAIYLFTRRCLLGAGRAWCSIAGAPCVPLIGWIALGEIPSALQLAGSRSCWPGSA
jgi:drug/metabolite transporter (DMT)-like permease